MLLGFLQDDEYLAEGGVLVAADGDGGEGGDGQPGPGLGPGIDPGLLHVSALQLRSRGTVAQAGAGWLWGRATQEEAYQVARLEAHDGPPAGDQGEWEEVLETPYWSRTGRVQLEALAGGPEPEPETLAIGPPGRYRVRVSCVRGAGPKGSDEGDVWRLQFWPAPDDREPPRWLLRTETLTGAGDDLATDLISVARWTPAGAAYSVGDLAARLLASPDEVREALMTAVHDDHLVVDGDLTESQAPLVLTLRTDWPGSGESPAAADFDPEGISVEGVLPSGFLASLGAEGIGPAEFPAELDAGRIPQPAEREERESWPFRTVADWPPLLVAPPPAAGIITGHQELVVWRDGQPVVLGRVRQYSRALETPFGIVIINAKLAALIRPDGQRLELTSRADWRTGLSGDGRYLAIGWGKDGRRPEFRLYLADLADGSSQVVNVPGPLQIDTVGAGWVSYHLAPRGEGDPEGSFTWTPGTSPAPAPGPRRETDRISGAVRTETPTRGARITRPDGTELVVERQYSAEELLWSPGGRWLYSVRYGTPTMTVTDVSGPSPSPPVSWPLLDNAYVTEVMSSPPAWEDDTHVLLAPAGFADLPGIRLDVTTGAAERIALDRQGRGKSGSKRDETEFDVDRFVEPFRPV